jgi:hypothetical protein
MLGPGAKVNKRFTFVIYKSLKKARLFVLGKLYNYSYKHSSL